MSILFIRGINDKGIASLIPAEDGGACFLYDGSCGVYWNMDFSSKGAEELTLFGHEMCGLKNQNTVFATGKSIFDRSSKTNIGELMLKYGGGGHQAAGTCQVPNDKAEVTLQELIRHINADG